MPLNSSTHPLLDPAARQRGLLVALWAWAGLGANGLSAACYGPEKAYVALGSHAQLGPMLALIMVASVAIIALAYSQMLELFPNGGGSYRVTSQLLGPNFGLVSGAALLIDYVLAICVSLTSGTDALFSLLPPEGQTFKLPVELGLAGLLVVLNLRGLRVAIGVLLPIVLLFLFVHALLIVFGISLMSSRILGHVGEAFSGSLDLSQTSGWAFVVALVIRAYGLGGSTYSGIEAISNNVNLLAEPRIRTGRLALLYVALTLAFTAGGLILLYSLWDIQPVSGQTLNATLLSAITAQLGLHGRGADAWMSLTMGLEAAILLVAANAMLIFAPTLLANMASDSWLPHQFRNLSVRLVRQNGIVFIGVFALAILYATHGDLATLVVFYSINVFLSFALAKAGLLRYWWGERSKMKYWIPRIFVAAVGLIVAGTILVVTLTERFSEGGWATIGLTLIVIAGCVRIRAHYSWVSNCRRKIDEQFALTQEELKRIQPVSRFANCATAVLLTTEHWGPTIHTLLWVQRLFPGHFRNILFVGVIEFDSRAMGASETLPRRTSRLEAAMHQLEGFCAKHGLHADRLIGYGTDPVLELERLVKDVTAKGQECVCFANKLILPPGRRLSEWLHNQTSLALQRRLHAEGIPLMVMPIRLG